MNRRKQRAGLATIILCTALLGALGSATDGALVAGPSARQSDTPPPVNSASSGGGSAYPGAAAPAAQQARLGVALNDLSPQDQAFYKRQTGAVVEAVVPGSLAARSGFLRNDLIIAIDKQLVNGAADVISAVTNVPADQRLSFRLIRNGKEQSIDVSF